MQDYPTICSHKDMKHTIPDDFPLCKVLIDKETGATCRFNPCKNRDRTLGPDFDYNPMNYPDLPEYFKYAPTTHYKDYTKIYSPVMGNTVHFGCTFS